MQSIASNPIVAYAAAKFRALGLAEHQIAGVLGSVFQESGWKPNAYNQADPNGGSVGIMQWNGARLDSLREWANANGVDMYDGLRQVDYAVEELMSTEGKALAKVRAAATAGEASDAWTRYYERPSTEGLQLNKRREYTDQIAGELNLSLDQASGENGAVESMAQNDPNLWKILGDGDTGGMPNSRATISTKNPAEEASKDTMRREGGWIDDDNILQSGFDAIINPGKGGTYGQTLSSIGGFVGGLPGLAIGSLVGGMLDSHRTKQDQAGGGVLDTMADAIDGLFGVTDTSSGSSKSRLGDYSSTESGDGSNEFEDAIRSSANIAADAAREADKADSAKSSSKKR